MVRLSTNEGVAVAAYCPADGHAVGTRAKGINDCFDCTSFRGFRFKDGASFTACEAHPQTTPNFQKRLQKRVEGGFGAQLPLVFSRYPRVWNNNITNNK